MAFSLTPTRWRGQASEFSGPDMPRGGFGTCGVGGEGSICVTWRPRQPKEGRESRAGTISASVRTGDLLQLT